MRMRFALALFGLLCAVCAMGQQRLLLGTGLTIDQSSAFLLAETKLQRELGMTEEQIGQLNARFGRHAAEQTRAFESKPDEEALLKLDRAFAADALALLRPNQRERLREIALQEAGPRALLDDDVAKQLGLDAPQRTQIVSIFRASTRVEDEYNAKLSDRIEKLGEPKTPAQEAAFDQKLRAIMTELAPDRKRMEAAEAQARKDAVAVLRPAQAQTWRAMLGKPFKF